MLLPANRDCVYIPEMNSGRPLGRPHAVGKAGWLCRQERSSLLRALARGARTLAGQYESLIEIVQSLRPELRHASFLSLQINLHYSLRKAPRLTQFRLANLCIHLIRDSYEVLFRGACPRKKRFQLIFHLNSRKSLRGFFLNPGFLQPLFCQNRCRGEEGEESRCAGIRKKFFVFAKNPLPKNEKMRYIKEQIFELPVKNRKCKNILIFRIIQTWGQMERNCHGAGSRKHC